MTTGRSSPGAEGRFGASQARISERFRAVWQDLTDPSSAPPELAPVRLARACVSVLGADAAGLSVVDDEFRVPLGASDDLASTAERLQFTQGEGPCLYAAAHRQILLAGPDQIDRQWPSFAAELFTRTPYRAIASVPLSLARSTRGAIDLYFIDEGALESLRLSDAITVADAVVEALGVLDEEQPPGGAGSTVEPVRSWLSAPTARHRRFVWLAVGMVMASFEANAPDALALLRSYAYGNGTDLDELALGLVEGRLSLEQLQI